MSGVTDKVEKDVLALPASANEKLALVRFIRAHVELWL